MPTGQHISIQKFGHQHHMILITDDQRQQSVIHKDVEKGGLICRVPLQDALVGKAYTCIDRGDQFSAQEIADNAINMVGEEGYDLFFNNCEHFANWCATGEWQSQQVGFGADMFMFALVMLKSENRKIRMLAILALQTAATSWLITLPSVQESPALKNGIKVFAASIAAATVIDNEAVKEAAFIGMIVGIGLVTYGVISGPAEEKQLKLADAH